MLTNSQVSRGAQRARGLQNTDVDQRGKQLICGTLSNCVFHARRPVMELDEISDPLFCKVCFSSDQEFSGGEYVEKLVENIAHIKVG